MAEPSLAEPSLGREPSLAEPSLDREPSLERIGGGAWSGLIGWETSLDGDYKAGEARHRRLVF